MDVMGPAVGLLACVLCVGGMGCGREAPETPASPPGPVTARRASPMPARASHGWPVLGRLERLCSGQVLGVDQSEILWEAYTSADPAEHVLARYRSELGDGGLETLGRQAWVFRAHAAGRVSRALEISAKAPPPIGSGCPPAPPGTQAFVLFSEFLSR